MGERTGIAWTSSTWNPIRGSSRVSEGCRNCYAERVAARFSGEEEGIETNGPEGWRTTKPEGPFYGFAENTPEGPRWTGKVALVEKHLLDPLRWTKPRRIFVNSMSDLFHESLPDEAIDRVFAVMALAPRHTFQILTKRPERMRAYLSAPGVDARIWWAARSIYSTTGGLWWRGRGVIPDFYDVLPVPRPGTGPDGIGLRDWPLPNAWLGTSTEDQATADERIPLLLQTPAAVRFVSAEPLLGPVDLTSQFGMLMSDEDGEYGPVLSPGLSWVITGGESGPGARPCDIAWIRSIVQQCKAAGVACFVKQVGPRPVCKDPDCPGPCCGGPGFYPKDRKGADPAEWPEDLRVQEFPR